MPCFANVRPDRPEVFCLEGCDDLMALHCECEGGRLAGPIGDHRCIQIAILALQTLTTVIHIYTKELALQVSHKPLPPRADYGLCVLCMDSRSLIQDRSGQGWGQMQVAELGERWQY